MANATPTLAKVVKPKLAKVIKPKVEKKKITRNPKLFDEKYVGEEPVWDTEAALEYTSDESRSHLIQSLNYYNYFYTIKDLKPYLVEWLQEYNEANEILATDAVIKFAKVSDNLIPVTACALIKAHRQGMPLSDSQIEYILRVVSSALNINLTNDATLDTVKAPVAPKVEQVKITIQDRINEIAKEHIFYFIDYEDELFEGKTVDPKAFDYLTSKIVPQAMLGKIIDPFQTHYNEFMEAKAGTCEQLSEGYKHLKAADYKRIELFYTKLFDGIKQYADVKKATKKAKLRKPPAKEKLVAKLKYLKTDNNLKVASINPVDIIGSKELWVYNIKTRKIGKYVADEQSGGALSIKGSAIVGYDETGSVSKTLRKPELQLKEFMNAGKIQLRKYMDTIKATEIKLNGRINSDTILLKVN